MASPLAIAAAFFTAPLVAFYILVRFGWSVTASVGNLALVFRFAVAYVRLQFSNTSCAGLGIFLAMAPPLPGR